MSSCEISYLQRLKYQVFVRYAGVCLFPEVEEFFVVLDGFGSIAFHYHHEQGSLVKILVKETDIYFH